MIFLLSLTLFSLFLQHNEMQFHSRAHNHIGAYPEDVVLIYGTVNFYFYFWGDFSENNFDGLVL